VKSNNILDLSLLRYAWAFGMVREFQGLIPKKANILVFVVPARNQCGRRQSRATCTKCALSHKLTTEHTAYAATVCHGFVASICICGIQGKIQRASHAHAHAVCACEWRALFLFLPPVCEFICALFLSYLCN